MFVLFISTSAHAAGFVKKQFDRLEGEVRADHKIEFIAKKLSELKTFQDWPKDLNNDLKLYIGVTWFNQRHIAEALDLLKSFKPSKKYHDLWAYYQAMLLMHKDSPDEASRYLAILEKKYKKNVDFLFLKSIYLSQKEDLISAIQVMDRIIKKDKKNGDAYLQRGFFYLLSLTNDLAMKDFTKAIKYLPKHEIYKRQQALFQNGLLYIHYKYDQKKGMTLIKQGVNLDPSSEMVKQVKQALRRK